MRRTARGLVAVALLAGACGGRADRPAPAVPHDRVADGWSPTPATGAEVVAEVNGARIYAADVRAQLAAHGGTPRDALQTLIDAELVAQEARRRGLAGDPDVRDARERALVRAFAAREFVPGFDGPEDVPDSEVEAYWNHPRYQAYFNHDEYHVVAYVRVPVAAGAGSAQDETARVLATRLADHLAALRPATEEDFHEAARKEAAAAGASLQEGRYATTREGPAVPEFVAAAFSVSKVGAVTRPARTKWGWDVLWLAEIIPARRATKEEAAREIRARRFEAARRQAFVRWADAFVARAGVVRHEQALGRLVVDSLVGMR